VIAKQSSTSTRRRPSRPQPDREFEHEGLLWKPLPGATASFDEFLAARSTMLAIQLDSIWTPWLREDRESDLQEATEIFERWTRAEPDFRPLTAAQFKRRMAKWDREFESHTEKSREAQQRRRATYDPDRAAARLALLEYQAYMFIEDLRRQKPVDHTAFPSMDDRRRQERIAECDTNLARWREAVDRLSEQVGDPETVADQWGWLPAERREHSRIGSHAAGSPRSRSCEQPSPIFPRS
jgi:hypothetical protein